MKKILCLLLVTLLALGAFAGCSSPQTSPSASPSAAPSSASPTSEEPGYVYVPTDFGPQELSGVTTPPMKFDMVAQTVQLPLTQEPTTFTVWWPFTPMGSLSNYGEFPDVQEIEKRTNVHIEWDQPSAQDVDTAYQLMMSSQDYPDMIYYSEKYIGGGDKAIDDGVYLRLNELIDEYAPNYNAIRTYTDNSRKSTITGQGNIWAFYALCKEDMPGYQGLVLRKDFLDKIGAEVPVTISDWENVLGKFKNELGLDYSLGIPPTGRTQFSAFVSAWDVGSSMYQEKGTVKYGPVEKGFYEYLKLMNDWYNKGYLRNDFYAETEVDYNKNVFHTELGSGKNGAVDGHNFFGTMLKQFNLSQDENLYVVAARNPVLAEGNEMHFRQSQGTINGNQLSITTACKNPELAVKWLDYRYSYEGYMTVNYGVEGYTWEWTDGGNETITFTKAVTEDPDVTNPMMALYGKYATGFQATLVDYGNGWCFLDPVYPEQIMVWQQDGSDYELPKLTFLSTEDSAEYANLYNEIETYVKESVPRFINGSTGLDTFDKFVEQLNSMGLKRCIEIQQAALDDYNKR